MRSNKEIIGHLIIQAIMGLICSALALIGSVLFWRYLILMEDVTLPESVRYIFDAFQIMLGIIFPLVSAVLLLIPIRLAWIILKTDLGGRKQSKGPDL